MFVCANIWRLFILSISFNFPKRPNRAMAIDPYKKSSAKTTKSLGTQVG